MAWWASILVFSLHVLAGLAQSCPGNCSGSPCREGLCMCDYPSNSPDCSSQWVSGSVYVALMVYIVVFSILFFATVIASALQLGRLIYYTGARPNVPKALHVVVFLQGCFRVAWLLTAGVAVLHDSAAKTVAEGLLDGGSVAALVVCYLLSILLWLQVYNQIGTIAERRSCWVRRRTLIVFVAIGFYVCTEVALRVIWTFLETNASLFALIAVYNSFVMLATLACTICFLLIFVLLYRILRDADQTPASRERFLTVVTFTTFTFTVACITMAVSVTILFSELYFFHFRNWDSWLGEQYALRTIEAGYSIGILWILRKVPPHEVRPERRGLLSPDPGIRNNPNMISRTASTDSGDEEERVRKALGSAKTPSNLSADSTPPSTPTPVEV